MAAANITIKVDPFPALASLSKFAHTLWELQWETLTGVPWKASTGKPRGAEFDVTLGNLPHASRVRIRGTALEVHCRKAEVIHEVGDVGVLRLEIPMVGSMVKVRTA